jgi:outer membrane receptor protein involved in Fe transport
LNLTTSYAWGDWQLSAWAHNLNNAQYIAAADLNFCNEIPLATAGEPRTYEITIKRFFDHH